jgi:hypothetical protein
MISMSYSLIFRGHLLKINEAISKMIAETAFTPQLFPVLWKLFVNIFSLTKL